MADSEDKCKCPGCNCFSGLVHVSTEGTYVVLPGGRVREAIEARHSGVVVYMLAVKDEDE